MSGTPRNIILTVTSIDGVYKRRTFTTLAGARRCAHRYVGEHPDWSEAFRYAIDNWGVTKVTVAGASYAELWPPRR